MAGLPGAGKSSVAERLAVLLGAALVSVDPIESAIRAAGIPADQPTGLAAYCAAEAVAGGILATGQSVIIDAVNAVEPARLQWITLAARAGAPLRMVEVVCSDPAVHRARLESRDRGLSHLPEPTWHRVERVRADYAAWSGASADVPRITVDSVAPLSRVVDDALAFLAAQC
ncbi:AAA family ATPase [Planctomonas psychrotolerans]|uniref:AAA family ATPase n=1 Tax=Planctomonas psychrotolerans TaxID=2528712 RepID=UPI00123A1115|nr:AAA family ATPase [Planctomonas psychrotolerans]